MIYSLFIYFVLFSIAFYTPAIVNWYSEFYFLDVFILLIGGLFLFIRLLKFSTKMHKIFLLISFIFIYFVFAYSASGNFLNPIYGIKQFIFLFSFFLFNYVILHINNISKIIEIFFKLYSLTYFVLYISGIGAKVFPNSLLPRLNLENIILYNDIQLVGSSAIILGTLSVISYAFFLINKNIKKRKIYIFVSFLLVIFSGTRASLLELIIVHFILAYSINYKKAIKTLFKIIIVLILLSPLIYLIFKERITDADSNSVHLMLWGMAIAMFLQNPLTGMGVNTFHKLKNSVVEYSLPESYGVHSTFFKFLGEGGLLLILVYIAFVYLAIYFFKKRKYIYIGYYNLYMFSLVSFILLMFHSIFDNYLMAKVNEYLYVLLLSIMFTIYKKSRPRIMYE